LVRGITLEGLRKKEELTASIAALSENPEMFLSWLSLKVTQTEIVNTTQLEAFSFLEENLQFGYLFFSKEKELKEKLLSAPDNSELLLELKELNQKAGNWILVVELLKKIIAQDKESPESYYLLGKIFLKQYKISEAEDFFQKAVDMDPGFIAKIKAFRYELGEHYLKEARLIKNIGRQRCIYLLNKGLVFSPEHQGLNDELRSLNSCP
jgi:tetratricopeptide (TPR) repeat protein